MRKFLLVLMLFTFLFTPLYAKGLKAKDFTLLDENGKPVKLSDLKGNVVVLVFWATTCGSCRRELPEISVLQGEYEGKPVKFFAVVVNTEDLDEIKMVKKEWGFDIPVLVADYSVKKDYKVLWTPTIYVIDKDGRIAKIILGSGKLEKLKKTIDKLIGGSKE